LEIFISMASRNPDILFDIDPPACPRPAVAGQELSFQTYSSVSQSKSGLFLDCSVLNVKSAETESV